MFCTRCGKEQAGSPKFCRSCGADMSSQAHGAAAQQNARKDDRSMQQKTGGVHGKPPLMGVPIVGWLLYTCSLNHLVNIALRLRRGRPGFFWGYDLFQGVIATFVIWGGLPGILGLILAGLLGLDPESDAGTCLIAVFFFLGLALACMAGVRAYRWAAAPGVGGNP